MLLKNLFGLHHSLHQISLIWIFCEESENLFSPISQEWEVPWFCIPFQVSETKILELWFLYDNELLFGLLASVLPVFAFNLTCSCQWHLINLLYYWDNMDAFYYVVSPFEPGNIMFLTINVCVFCSANFKLYIFGHCILIGKSNFLIL